MSWVSSGSFLLAAPEVLRNRPPYGHPIHNQRARRPDVLATDGDRHAARTRLARRKPHRRPMGGARRRPRDRGRQPREPGGHRVRTRSRPVRGRARGRRGGAGRSRVGGDSGRRARGGPPARRRPHGGAPRGARASHHPRAGEAPRRIARRDRLRGELRALVRGGSAPPLRGDRPLPGRGQVPARLPRAGRADPSRQLGQRPLRDDHPQGRAGPRRRLPPRRQAPPRDPVQRSRRGAALRGGGPPARRHQRDHHHPLGRVLPDPPRAPRDAAHHVHRVVGRRPASRRAGGRAHEGHDHGARRPRAVRGLGRRGSRPRGE